MEKKTTILVADDHPLFRGGVVNFLKDRDYIIVGEAKDGEETIEMVKFLSPDILILDMDMPKLNGIQVMERINKISLITKTILLTMYKEEKLFNKVMDLGISGYLLKESAVMEILDCMDAILKNNYFISPVLSSFLMKRFKRKEDLESQKKGLASLTEMERRILKLTAQSLTSKQIADELFISPRTVDKHRENICNKIEIHGCMKLLKFAIENKHSI